MHLRNRIALYGSYSLGLAGVGFTLPYLPLFLGQRGMSDRTIGLLSTLAALAGLVQFPIGIWSDRLSRRRPFLLAAYAALAVSTILLLRARNLIWLGFLVVVFAENGLCRPAADSLSGATAAILSAPGQVGTALGALRFWRPVGIIAMCVVGGLLAQRYGVASILWPLAAIQILAVVVAWFLREQDGGQSLPLTTSVHAPTALVESVGAEGTQSTGQRDRVLWIFVAAMILFHIGNAPGGVYLGLFARRELHASERFLVTCMSFVVQDGSAMIRYRFASETAALSQTIAGAIVHHFGDRAGFLFLAVVAAVAFVILWLLMPETLGWKQSAIAEDGLIAPPKSPAA